MRTTTRVVGLLAATTLTLTTLTACSNDDTDSGGSATGSSADAQVSDQHNDADVEFATEMIPHHAQAIVMAEMAEDRADSQDVKDLAADIKAAQGPEIDRLSTMLETWGEDVPDPDSGMGGAGGMDHGAAGDNMDDMHETDRDSVGESGMPGMMSSGNMADLKSAFGMDFDEMFLQMMIEHHEGAIEMAQTEQADGENPQAIDLAKGIEAAQTQEIVTMKKLLTS
jgi:uncharacterized protein (DUF305 family)